VLDWHRIAICCAAAGEISLYAAPRRRILSSGRYRPAGDDPREPVFVHRMAAPHLAGRDVVVDCRRRLGMRHFSSDLPADFGLRAALGRLPAPPAKEETP
jgi:hypothetical protein